MKGKNKISLVTCLVIASWLSWSIATAASIDGSANSAMEPLPQAISPTFPKLEGLVEVTVEAERFPAVASETSSASMDSRPKADKSFAYEVNDVDENYEAAFRRSEWIGVCEYRGYKKSADIGFYNPPQAMFYWSKCLKGPPLQRVPVKFEFYDTPGTKMPEGWKFSEDKMPELGSQWIIFIPNAVPTDKGFETYSGAYGRQEATEHNLNEIYAIIEAHHGQI